MKMNSPLSEINNMVVKHLNPQTFDVFFENGWNNWGRFFVDKNQVTQIAGEKVPTNIQKFLVKRYCK